MAGVEARKPPWSFAEGLDAAIAAADSIGDCVAQCVEANDKEGPHIWRLFCDTTNQTRNISWYYPDDAPPNYDGFFGPYDLIEGCIFGKCRVAALSPGSCECPANCYSRFNQGQCSPQGCKCAPGWTGRDCSMPSCPENSCSGHGTCIDPTTPFRLSSNTKNDKDNKINKADFGSMRSSRKLDASYCQCDMEWTGFLCDAPVTNLPVLPYGEIFPGNRSFYSSREKYGDNHPIFNLSVIGVVELIVDPKDLEFLLAPENAHTDNLTKATMRFYNGYIDQTLKGVGVAVRGSKARSQLKRGFKLSVDKFGHHKRDFFGMKAFSVDAEWQNPTQMNHIITNELFRAVGVSGMRMSFAQVFVNDIYYGMYTLAEEPDRDWIAARYQKHHGNIYKLDLYQWLSNASNAMYNVRMDGDGNWTNWVHFVTRLNDPTITREEYGSLANVDLMTRAAVVDIYSVFGDGYIHNGNNFGFYEDPLTGLFEYDNRDYESTLRINFTDGAHGLFWDDFYRKDPWDPNRTAPLLYQRIVQDPILNATYVSYFEKFLSAVFSDEGRNALLTRIGQFGTIMANQLGRDAFFDLSGGRNALLAQTMVGRVQVWVLQRALSCAQELNFTIPSLEEDIERLIDSHSHS